MELAVFDQLVAYCIHVGIKVINGTYIKTPKNAMVESHYAELGFELESKKSNGDSHWRYLIPDNYEFKNKHIGVNK
jgi:predicted enzyme involved in methoxymalonyl-ACP biosynthesis